MIISTEVSTCAAIYEAQTGMKVPEDVLRIIDGTHQLGMRLEELGRKHAAECYQPIHESEVQKLTREIRDLETEREINKYLFECYMAGYNARNKILGQFWATPHKIVPNNTL